MCWLWKVDDWWNDHILRVWLILLAWAAVDLTLYLAFVRTN
jgi:hypothetical protein